MNKCPKCGAELAEGSRYCFYCMSTLNPRQTITIPKVRLVPVPAIAASALCAAAVITGGVVFAHNTLGKSLPKAASTELNNITSSAASSDTESVSEYEPYDVLSSVGESSSSAAETTTVTETSSVAEEPSSSETVTETTTTTTTAPQAYTIIEESPVIPEETPVEEYEEQPEYLDPEGSTGLSNALCDFVNPMRAEYGANPLRPSGQLDRACQMAADALPEDKFSSMEINPMAYFDEAGLSKDHEIQFVVVWSFWRNEEGKDDKEVFIKWVKREFMTVGTYPADFEWLDTLNMNNTNLSYGIKDYNYLSVVCRRDPSGDNAYPPLGKKGDCLVYWIVAMK